MKKDKVIKKQIIKEASSNPEKYFPVEFLKSKGFKRYKCEKTGMMFWSTVPRKFSGDTDVVGGYQFIENTPAKKSLEFTEVYKEFSKHMTKRGYKHINRFPIVARWRDDLDFNIASIIGFQPYVTGGEIAPPAKMLTIPQNCLRFPDIDNVGYTGRHHTSFTMIGQHVFKKPQEYDQTKYVKDFLEWFTDVMKIPIDEIQIHEDAWTGGGNCGPSLEFFSRGLELGNQVYMWYDMSEAENIDDLKELNIKVLDMGMGLERCCWYSKGSLNSFEANMPRVIQYLKDKTGIVPDWKFYRKFVPLGGNLNLDEVDDIDKEWENISKELKVEVEELKNQIEPIAGLYSIADHSKTLLYALTDGALPSNVKGGYNLRLVLRRALDFIHKFDWDIDLYDVIVVQAEEVSELYPELRNELEGIKKIIDLETKKYKNHKEKVDNKIKSILNKKDKLELEDFVKYYISEGITPEEIKQSYENNGKTISIPANFYTAVNEYFESRKESEVKENKNKLKEFIKDVPDTKMEFYKDTYKDETNAKILKEFEFEKKKFVVLNKTLFYPTMGGQAHDIGFIGDKKVVDVIKVEGVILHQIE